MTKPKIVTIVGTRPQLIKLSPYIPSIVINTGQHYDDNMNDNFIDELDISVHYTLENKETVWNDLRNLLFDIEPDLGIVYGDTNSTLLGAEALWELKIPIAHIESGNRCGRKIPEEQIRIKVDEISVWLFCATKSTVDNLLKEGFKEGIYLVGDVLYDRYVMHREHGGYVLLTIHRKNNLDKETLEEILYGLPKDKDIIFPVHPHIKKVIKEEGIILPLNIQIIEPVSYKRIQNLINKAELVLTDSGGIQREAFFNGTPFKVLRESHDWPETEAFGDGEAGKKIYKILLKTWEEKCLRK